MTDPLSPGGPELTFKAIKRACKFLWAPEFDVRLIHETGELNPPILRISRDRELLRAETVKWLRAKNAQGYNVFFRPISNEFVLVDDLSVDALDAMARGGIRTAAEIETSKANLQAWIRIGDRSSPADHDTAMRVARYLASTYGGDMRSAKPEQLGRLPGLRNRKQRHQDANGGYPLVVVRRAVFTGPQNSVMERALSSPSPPSPRSASELGFDAKMIMKAPITDEEARGLWNEAHADLETRFGPLPNGDRSAVDYRVARHFAVNGMEREIAAKVIMLNSAKARERGADYVP